MPRRRARRRRSHREPSVGSLHAGPHRGAAGRLRLAVAAAGDPTRLHRRQRVVPHAAGAAADVAPRQAALRPPRWGGLSHGRRRGPLPRLHGHAGPLAARPRRHLRHGASKSATAAARAGGGRRGRAGGARRRRARRKPFVLKARRPPRGLGHVLTGSGTAPARWHTSHPRGKRATILASCRPISYSAHTSTVSGAVLARNPMFSQRSHGSDGTLSALTRSSPG